MEIQMMASVINDNVIDKVVGRTKKEKEKPKDAGDDFHAISPEQMKLMLRNLNALRAFMKEEDVSESVFDMRNRIDAIEGMLLNQLRQIEDPELQGLTNAELLQQILDMHRANQNNGQTWITSGPTTITPYITSPFTGGGGSGDVIWPTINTTTASDPQEILGWGGLLPKNDDE